ncbi:MAG: sugar transferase [bacterium]|nr:sugar transferase [bacterium]
MIRQREIKNFILSLLNVFFYFTSITFSFIIAYFLFEFIINKFDIPFHFYSFKTLITHLMIVLVIWGIMFAESGILTDKRLTSIDKLLIILKETIMGTIILMIIHEVYQDFLLAQTFIIFSWFISVILIYFSTIIVYYLRILYRRKNLPKRHILIIGKNSISKKIKNKNRENYRGKTFFYPYPNINLNILKKYLQKRKITELILTENFLSKEKLLNLSDICEEFGTTIKFSPSILELRMGEVTVDNDIGIPILQLKPVSFLDKNFINKRLFDVIFSIIILTIFMLPMLFIALLVRLSSRGPIFFIQERVGLHGKLFNFYKFRSMIMHADKILHKFKHLNERSGPVFKIKKDPRVTLIGSFLRKSSLDEFPQFFNVLKGDMSIVGPRPPIPHEVATFTEIAMRRFKVFPGITGIWQISGRCNLSFDEMINLDIYYLEHWSLSLDIEILIKTIPAVVMRKGAC